MGAIVCVDALSALPLAGLRAEEKAKRFATIQLISIAVNIGLNILFMGFLFDKSRPEEGVLFILIANLIASIVKPVMLADSFSLLRLGVDKEIVKKMLLFAIPLVIAGFAGIINETLDRILLKQLLFNPGDPSSLKYAEAQVGIYSACYKLAMLVTILLQAYRYAAEPFFFNQFKNEERNKVYVRVMNLFVATVCFVFLLVSLNLDIFKHFIRNEAYWIGLNIVPILLLANVFLGIYYNQSIWYKLSGKTKYGAYISIFGAIITVVINWLFIPIYGFLASAWATLIVYAFQMILSYLLGQKHYPIPYNLRKFYLYLFSALGIFALSSFLDIKEFVPKLLIHNLLLAGFLGMVFYLENTSFQFGNRNTK
ncbi:MAG: polysaccharide biosynthesis protein [Bacteroidetes bacterium]|nr:polysaccharide biosynthesis protein [Bacteroidota bacterium]